MVQKSSINDIVHKERLVVCVEIDSPSIIILPRYILSSYICTDL